MGKHHKQIIKEEWLFCGHCQIKVRPNLRPIRNIWYKLTYSIQYPVIIYIHRSETLLEYNLCLKYIFVKYLRMRNCSTSNNSCININPSLNILWVPNFLLHLSFGFILVTIRERFVLSPFWDYLTVDLLKYICIDAV